MSTQTKLYFCAYLSARLAGLGPASDTHAPGSVLSKWKRKRERGRVREMPISIPAVAGTAATSPMKQAKLVQILNLTETRTASKMLHSLRWPSTTRRLLSLPPKNLSLFVVFQTMCNALENTCFRFFISCFVFRLFRPQKLPACIMYVREYRTASDRHR